MEKRDRKCVPLWTDEPICRSGQSERPPIDLTALADLEERVHMKNQCENRSIPLCAEEPRLKNGIEDNRKKTGRLHWPHRPHGNHGPIRKKF